MRRLGLARFTAAVRAELPRWGATRPCLRIVGAVFAALTDPAGVTAQRPGALERAGLALADWRDTRRRLAEVETRMVAVLDELDLTDLVCSIDGLTAVGAAAILAETGDPARFGSPRAVVKHAGLCPRDNASGAAPGQDQHLRQGPARAAAGRLAGGLGRPAQQPGAGRPVPVSDHPGAQPAGPPTSPRRLRRGAAALAARRGHPARRLGSRHRRRTEAALEPAA